MSTDIPKEWMPLLQWHGVWHYGKQREFVQATEDYWEIVFVAGNGTGKSHIFYWNLVTLAFGIHPFQFAQPPLRIKVLVTDFEHGYGKIFRETVLDKQYMPKRYEVWNGGDAPCAWFAEEHRANEFVEAHGFGNIETKKEAELGPMLHKKFVKSWPSRDDRTLELTNESYFFFQTSEQKKRLHSGTNFDILGCDEEPDFQVYDESKRGLRRAKGGGKIYHAFTPPFDEETKNKGPTWTKFKLIDPYERNEDPDVKVIRASVYDNPALTDTWIRKFSKGKTEEQIRIQLYGDYPTWGKLIFPDFTDEMWNAKLKTGHLLPHDFEVPWNDPDVRFEMALDWHGSKPPAVIWAMEYMAGPNKGDVIVFDEISPQEGRGMTIMDTAQAIREHEGWRRARIKRWGDPKMKDVNNALISGFSPWDEFRHCGIRLNEAWNREPYVGYSIINDFLRGKGQKNIEHPRLFIVETCKSLRHNMKNHYNLPKNDGTATPDPKFSDYCVNLKYIMLKKSRKQKKNFDKMGKHSKWPIHTMGLANEYGTYVSDFR